MHGIHAGVSKYMYVCIHTRMYVCVYACMYVCMVYSILTYINIPTCKNTYMHTYIHTHMQKYIHAYIHTYIPTCKNTYIHTYTCTVHEGRRGQVRICREGRSQIRPGSFLVTCMHTCVYIYMYMCACEYSLLLYA